MAVAVNGDVYISNQIDSDVMKAKLNPDGIYTTSTLANLPGSNPAGIAVAANSAVYLVDANYLQVYIFQTAVKFGAVPVASTSGTVSLSFEIDTAGTLGSTAPYAVLTQGASALDFNAAATQPMTACASSQMYTANSICTVDLTFSPKLTGPRYGAAVLYNSSGAPIATAYISGTGTGPQLIFAPLTQNNLGGGFTAPEGAAVDGRGNLYVADDAVKEIPAGCASSSCVATLGGGFFTLGGVAVDGAGNIYVADEGNVAVKKMPPGCASSACVSIVGGGFSIPAGIAVDGAGNVYVADYAGEVKSFAADCSATSRVKTLGGVS